MSKNEESKGSEASKEEEEKKSSEEGTGEPEQPLEEKRIMIVEDDAELGKLLTK